MDEKAGKVASLPLPNSGPAQRGFRRGIRRSRGLRFLVLACVLFISYAQWRQLRATSESHAPRRPARTLYAPKLSASRLHDDLATCKKLRTKPTDPVGAGRTKSERYLDGHAPTLITSALVWTGEALAGTSPEAARKGKGYEWVPADVFVQYGLIQRVEANISRASLPKDTLLYDAKGRQLTSGIIDMHSHAGVNSLPALDGNEDSNEMSSDITPYVRSLDAIDPLDHQIQVIKSGGVTTSLILPGSGNNMGGEAFVIKHAAGKPDGRVEISATDMLADPNRNWRYMKMACGENAKRVYGRVGRGPFSRMGESWFFRHAFEQAADLVRRQDDWCDAAEEIGAESMNEYLPQELEWESLGALLRGQVLLNVHCYTVPDLEAFVDHTNEFKFEVRAFHHAHQTYLVPEILKRAYGGKPPASALFADNFYYKAEAYIASEYAGKILWENGLTPVYVSDNPVLNAQHVVFEAAKAYKYGLPYHVALAAVTTAPAELLGLGSRLGKIKPGYDADLVVWDSDPLSVGAAPAQLWIDGVAQYESPVELVKPATGPIVPDETLGVMLSEPETVDEVVFTGVRGVLLPGVDEAIASENSTVTVVTSKGKIVCIGSCKEEIHAAKSAGAQTIHLKNGYLTPSFTAIGSTLGLNEIDAEKTTDNGGSNAGASFSRGVDGLALDGKKLHVAARYGVARAISAPKFTGGGTHYGTSVGFLTDADIAITKGAVWSEDVALHYTLGLSAKHGGDTPSISSAVGALRKKLLSAVSNNETIEDAYSQEAYLRKAVNGEMPLVLTVHSADTIAAIIRVKKEVEAAISSTSHGISSQLAQGDGFQSESSSKKAGGLKIALIGGAESHLVAHALADADIGVVLAPASSYALEWDQRRAPSGAPLTNGTVVDALIEAGVVVAFGLEEDWIIRDLSLLAGIAYKNGGGKLGRKDALALVSSNIYTLLGIEEPASTESAKGREDFVLFEGDPLEIEGRVKAVGSGLGYTIVL